MATHSSTLAWKIPWAEEPGRLQSMGSLRVRHDWATSLSLFTFMHWRRKWQPTPVFLPGESIPGTGEPGGLLSMGSHRVRHDWSDLVAAVSFMLLWLTFCYITYVLTYYRIIIYTVSPLARFKTCVFFLFYSLVNPKHLQRLLSCSVMSDSLWLYGL